MKGSFEFILGMYSIIIGLGVSRLLEGVKDVVVTKKPLHEIWLYVGMLAIGLVVNATTWLSLWSLRNVEAWKLSSFLLVMLVPVLMYLYSAIAVPDNDPPVDLGEYYFDNASKMHGLLAAAIVVNGFTEFVMLGQVNSIRLTLMRLAIVGMLLVCAVRPRAVRLHRFIVPATLVGGVLAISITDVAIG